MTATHRVSHCKATVASAYLEQGDPYRTYLYHGAKVLRIFQMFRSGKGPKRYTIKIYKKNHATSEYLLHGNESIGMIWVHEEVK